MNSLSKALEDQQGRKACANCYLSKICLPVGLEQRDMQRLETLVNKRTVTQRGEYLFKRGDAFSKLMAVRSGSFKTFTSHSLGSEQIVGFYLPGEMVGFDGIHSGQNAVSCVALETSAVCEISFNKLLNLASEIPALQQQLLKLMSEKMTSSLSAMINSTAEQRIAMFLLSLSNRYYRCGYSQLEFNLSMSRHDIANYLGLATETISRIMSHFCKENILEVTHRHIHIKDLRQLQVLSCDNTNMGEKK